MKKLILSLTAVVLVSSTLYAQGVSGGLKAGLNFANQKYSSDIGDFSPSGRTSFHAGFFLTAMVSESFGVQPELIYNSVGAKIEFLGEESIQKLNYLTVPIMLRYNPVPVFNIHAGPQFGFLLSATTEADGDSEDVKDLMKGLDLGLGLGIGIDLPMGLVASARYNLGLSNTLDSEDDDDGKVTNNVIQISLGYKLFGVGD